MSEFPDEIMTAAGIAYANGCRKARHTAEPVDPIETIASAIAAEREACANAAYIPLQEFVDDLNNGQNPEGVTLRLIHSVLTAIRKRELTSSEVLARFRSGLAETKAALSDAGPTKPLTS